MSKKYIETINDSGFDYDLNRDFYQNPSGLPEVSQAEYNTISLNYLNVVKRMNVEVDYNNTSGADEDFEINIPHNLNNKHDFYGRYRTFNTSTNQYNNWHMFPTETFPNVVGRGGMFVKDNQDNTLILYYNPGSGIERKINFDISFISFTLDG